MPIIIKLFLGELLEDRRSRTLAVGRGTEHLYTNNKIDTEADSVLQRDCDQVRTIKREEFAHYSISLQKCKVFRIQKMRGLHFCKHRNRTSFV